MLWDHDEDQSARAAVKELSKIKSVGGLGRYDSSIVVSRDRLIKIELKSYIFSWLCRDFLEQAIYQLANIRNVSSFYWQPLLITITTI